MFCQLIGRECQFQALECRTVPIYRFQEPCCLMVLLKASCLVLIQGIMKTEELQIRELYERQGRSVARKFSCKEVQSQGSSVARKINRK